MGEPPQPAAIPRAAAASQGALWFLSNDDVAALAGEAQPALGGRLGLLGTALLSHKASAANATAIRGLNFALANIFHVLLIENLLQPPDCSPVSGRASARRAQLTAVYRGTRQRLSGQKSQPASFPAFLPNLAGAAPVLGASEGKVLPSHCWCYSGLLGFRLLLKYFF